MRKDSGIADRRNFIDNPTYNRSRIRFEMPGVRDAYDAAFIFHFDVRRNLAQECPHQTPQYGILPLPATYKRRIAIDAAEDVFATDRQHMRCHRDAPFIGRR